MAKNDKKAATKSMTVQSTLNNGVTVQGRLTQYEIAERRKQVQKLRMRGMSVEVISKMVNIGTKTVFSDLAAIQEESANALTNGQKAALVADSVATFQEVKERAWEEYHTSDTSNQRMRALDAVRNSEKDKLNALIDTGFIQKDAKPTQVEHVHKLDWSDEMRDKVTRSLLMNQLPTQLAEPLLHSDVEVIDVISPEGAIETRTLENDEQE